ncbi:MAG TPA: hypothetical protein VHO46_08095 [Bacteroidales bacterium]|nr:hypothetical protein [Bacteroidales bacterium]
MDLNGTIESAEKKFIQILEGFFISVYPEKELPSHDLSHHRRVWNTAKELILIAAEDNRFTDPRLIQSLLIASFLHDIGMATDRSPSHGMKSMELCKLFLAKNNLNESDFPGLLKAVLEHDNKDYSESSEITVHSLLSVADDLDAFGFTGIYRYIEIYSIRGIEEAEMAAKIRENSEKRYRHFEHLFFSHKELVQKHRKRYEILDSFFTAYNMQLRKGEDTGCIRVVRLLLQIVQNSENLNNLIQRYQNDEDQIVRSFFAGISSEMCSRKEDL